MRFNPQSAGKRDENKISKTRKKTRGGMEERRKRMSNRILLVILVSVVLLLGIFASTLHAPQPPVDVNTLILGTIGMPYRADPATAYDTASGALIMNVYEPLIDFYRNTSEPDPRKQGKVDQFVPRLATNWTKEIAELEIDSLVEINQSNPKSTKWVDPTKPASARVIHDLYNLTVVNQTNPVCTLWEEVGTLYHLYYWKDDGDGELGFCDIVFLVRIDPGTMLPIPCTERAYHVEIKDHIPGPPPSVHMTVSLHGCYYHINGWRDNKADGELGVYDVIYMEEIDPIMWEGIACTKFAWQVKLKEHVDSTIHLKVKRTWYIFELRTGVPIHPWKFYNGVLAPAANLTAEDVEYSFERALVQDRLYGPTWMLYKPILDAMSANDGWNLSDVDDLTDLAHLIDCAFQQNGTHIKINVGIDFPETAWCQILAQPWGMIVPKAFAIDHGCWQGTFFNASGYPYWIYWRRWPTYTRSPLDRAPTTLTPLPGAPAFNWAGHAEPPPILRGTGPYKFTHWTTSPEEWRIDKFDKYWKGWDPDPEHPYYVNTYISRDMEDWETRKSAFLNGDIDIIAVPRAYISQLSQPNGEPLPGILCYKDILLLQSDSLHFTFEVTAGSYAMPVIRGHAAPRFFGNVHTRRAFCYALNFTQLLEEAWSNEAERSATWHISGLSPNYRDPSIIPYDMNLTRVREELEAAIYNVTGTPESLWDSGFHVYIFYHDGNDQRRIASEMIKSIVESLNAERPGKPAFVIDLIPIYPWGYFCGGSLLCDPPEPDEMPAWWIGWCTDFADADNWVRPYMHSNGDFSYSQRYSNATVDIEIDLAVKTDNETLRGQLYYDLQRTFINECPSLMVVQHHGRAWMRNWVHGWYHNPLHSGTPARDRWKGYQGDLNKDHKVDIFDLVIVAAEFGKPPPPIDDPRADVNGDGVVDIFDLVIVAAEFGAGG